MNRFFTDGWYLLFIFLQPLIVLGVVFVCMTLGIGPLGAVAIYSLIGIFQTVFVSRKFG